MKKFLGIAAACFSFLAVPATAATFSNLSGIIEEGPNVVLPSGYTADHSTGDFGGRMGRTTLEFSDDAQIFGRVYGCCRDAFTIDAADYTFDLVISVIRGHRPFTLGVGVSGDDVNYRGRIDDRRTVLRWDNLSGEVGVVLNGRHMERGSVRWLVDVMNVTPVPLPATGLLLLGGLGLLGLGRRRKS